MFTPANHNKKGFTLIELLVVIAIIATLAVVAFVALDPVRRIRDAQNATRRTDVENISSAIALQTIDDAGVLPAGLVADGLTYQIGTCASGAATLCPGAQGACEDLSTVLAQKLSPIPTDPDSGTAATTGYSVSVDANNIVTVTSCGAEGVDPIFTSK